MSAIRRKNSVNSSTGSEITVQRSPSSLKTSIFELFDAAQRRPMMSEHQFSRSGRQASSTPVSFKIMVPIPSGRKPYRAGRLELSKSNFDSATSGFGISLSDAVSHAIIARP